MYTRVHRDGRTSEQLNFKIESNVPAARDLVSPSQNYQTMSRDGYEFIPLAFDVFGGTAPEAASFLRKIAGLAVRHKFGVTEGRVFAINYAAILSEWSARLSAVLTREVAKCVIEGARLARGGNQIDSSFDRLDTGAYQNS